MLLYRPLGDSGLRIEFSTIIERQAIIKIRSFQDEIESKCWNFVIECVASYTTLTIFYEPTIVSYEELVALCYEVELAQQHPLNASRDSCSRGNNIVEIPVLYGGEHGPDLADVAKIHEYTPEQVIEIHSRPTYLIYLIGFTPGFPYLGGMSDKIATPRLSKPRLKVKAGSIGIAGNQTGIYSVDSPGGWRIIGHTPVKIFDPISSSPFLFKQGDYVVFKPVDEKVYESYRG